MFACVLHALSFFSSVEAVPAEEEDREEPAADDGDRQRYYRAVVDCQVQLPVRRGCQGHLTVII